MDEIKEFFQYLLKKIDLKEFFRKKLLLLVALVLEIISLLIDRGVIDAPEYEGRFLVAGVVLMFIWLVMDGLQRKYRKMSAVYQANMAALDAEEKQIHDESVD